METSLYSENQPGGITSDLEGLLTRTIPDPASRGIRFVNFFIDAIFVSILSNILETYILPTSLNIFGSNAYTIGAYLIWPYLLYLMYYAVMEGAAGRTVGKFATATVVVRTDGNPLTFKDAFLRSLCRLIPFELFSGFGRPWHDSLTKTTVVKKAQL